MIDINNMTLDKTSIEVDTSLIEINPHDLDDFFVHELLQTNCKISEFENDFKLIIYMQKKSNPEDVSKKHYTIRTSIYSLPINDNILNIAPDDWTEFINQNEIAFRVYHILFYEDSKNAQLVSKTFVRDDVQFRRKGIGSSLFDQGEKIANLVLKLFPQFEEISMTSMDPTGGEWMKKQAVRLGYDNTSEGIYEKVVKRSNQTNL